MARVIDTTGQTVREGQSSKFLPLAAQEYVVSVYDVLEGSYKKDSAGEGRDNYRVQLRIGDGQVGANRRLFQTIPLFLSWGATQKNPDGSDAFTFYDFFAAIRGVKSKDYRTGVKVMLSKDKAEVAELLEKIGNEAFREEVAALAGKGLSIPSPEELLGKKVNVVLKIVPDTYAFQKATREDTLEPGETQQDYLTNDVSAWKPYAEVAAKAEAAPADAFVL